MSKDDPGLEALTSVVNGYREEYAELSETWRHIDGKAQVTASISGVFLAAIFAFIRDIKSVIPSELMRIGMQFTIIILMLSVVFAVLALWIRNVSTAPLGQPLDEITKDFLSVPEKERELRVYDFMRDQIEPWPEINQEIHKKNISKARFVISSQVSLLVAIIITAILSILMIRG